MGLKSTIRAMQAAERRQQRESQKHLRELERQLKEQAKLSAIEQARLEVETFESKLEVLLSVHKEQGETWDWLEFVAALPPHSPQKFSRHELKARQVASKQSFEEECTQDDNEYQQAIQAYSEEMAEWTRMKNVARRILAGEHKAYTEALVEFSSLTELSDLGSSIHFIVHSANLVECGLKVNGRQAIPKELKTLTTAGKVSVKSMPKARFHEIYQDYVCGCVLRVAREVLALLPVDVVMVTASADVFDSSTGQTNERPVLSVAIPRVKIDKLDFERADPSDAMENFLHRGDARASRKSGEFEAITPLTPSDLHEASPESGDLRDLFAAVRRVRDDLAVGIKKSGSQPAAAVSLPSQQL